MAVLLSYWCFNEPVMRSTLGTPGLDIGGLQIDKTAKRRGKEEISGNFLVLVLI